MRISFFYSFITVLSLISFHTPAFSAESGKCQTAVRAIRRFFLIPEKTVSKSSNPLIQPFINDKGTNVLAKALTNFAKKKNMPEGKILAEIFSLTDPVR